jgi:hypothetical protein
MLSGKIQSGVQSSGLLESIPNLLWKVVGFITDKIRRSGLRAPTRTDMARVFAGPARPSSDPAYSPAGLRSLVTGYIPESSFEESPTKVVHEPRVTPPRSERDRARERERESEIEREHEPDPGARRRPTTWAEVEASEMPGTMEFMKPTESFGPEAPPGLGREAPPYELPGSFGDRPFTTLVPESRRVPTRSLRTGRNVTAYARRKALGYGIEGRGNGSSSDDRDGGYAGSGLEDQVGATMYKAGKGAWETIKSLGSLGLEVGGPLIASILGGLVGASKSTQKGLDSAGDTLSDIMGSQREVSEKESLMRAGAKLKDELSTRDSQRRVDERRTMTKDLKEARTLSPTELDQLKAQGDAAAVLAQLLERMSPAKGSLYDTASIYPDTLRRNPSSRASSAPSFDPGHSVMDPWKSYKHRKMSKAVRKARAARDGDSAKAIIAKARRKLKKLKKAHKRAEKAEYEGERDWVDTEMGVADKKLRKAAKAEKKARKAKKAGKKGSGITARGSDDRGMGIGEVGGDGGSGYPSSYATGTPTEPQGFLAGPVSFRYKPAQDIEYAIGPTSADAHSSRFRAAGVLRLAQKTVRPT